MDRNSQVYAESAATTGNFVSLFNITEDDNIAEDAGTVDLGRKLVSKEVWDHSTSLHMDPKANR